LAAFRLEPYGLLGDSMDWKIVLTTFTTLFLAELGDKTQLAAITMTANTKQPLAVFIGGTLALAVVTGLCVVFGSALLEVVPAALVKKIAASAFVVIGVLMFFDKM